MIKYNDTVRRYHHNGLHKVFLTPCATISPTTKTLSVTREYGDLIANPEAVLDFLENSKDLQQFMVDKYGKTNYN